MKINNLFCVGYRWQRKTYRTVVTAANKIAARRRFRRENPHVEKIVFVL